MYKKIAVTQRQIYASKTKETYDSLDRQWYSFFKKCNIYPLFLPNDYELTKMLLDREALDGFLLTGGGNIASLGGLDAEREKIEELLINISIERNIPLLGVCRGMQKIQDFFSIPLKPIKGHVCNKQEIFIDNKKSIVNSYHDYGTNHEGTCFEIWARSKDFIIKGINHNRFNIKGIMWHPERIYPFREEDIKIFKRFYNIEE